MRLWHSLTFEHKITTFLAGLFLLVSINCALIYFFQNKTDNHIAVVAAWEKEQAQVAQIIYLLIKSESEDPYFERETERKLKAFNELLETTINGGILSTNEIKLAAAGDEEEIYKLQKVKSNWDILKSAVLIFMQEPPVRDSIYQRIEEVPINDTLNLFTTRVVNDIRSITNPAASEARSDIEEYFPAWNLASTEYIDHVRMENDEKQAAIINTTLLFWIFIAMSLLLLFVRVRKDIFLPLNNILLSGEKISRGYYEEKIDDKHQHELGKVSAVLNSTAETLKSATQFIQSLGQGKLQDNLVLKDEQSNEHTLSGALLKMQNQMQQLQQEEKERKWISEGLTKFADLLRANNDSLEKLTDKITAAIVKYTGSIVGGTYLLTDYESPELELKAFYALNTKKYLTRTYKPGEGLVGQTFLEEDYIYLLEIPDNYISVASGIGEISPKAILLVPLKMEQEVFGVLELASLREYKAHEIDFVRKLSESIAATIQSVKINERTKELLAESQEMTDMMRSQEEEMRQNMEELSATQEEMARKEKEMITRLQVVNNTVILAEYDMNKKLIHVSRNFATLYSYPMTEMTGISLFKLIPENNTAIEQVNDIWQEVSAGNPYKGKISRKDSTGKEFIVESIFTPVANDKGEVIKIVEIAHVAVKDSAAKEPFEIENTLRQNLNALEITQQVLSSKAQNLQQKFDALDHIIVIETDHEGMIKNKDSRLSDIIGTKITSVLAIDGISKADFSKHISEGVIITTDKKFKYLMKKLNEQSYLFLLVNI